MARNGERHFGAFVEPQGIHIVEYERERNGMSILFEQSDVHRVVGLAEAGERLANIIQRRAADGARVSVAIRDFGSIYQIMLLPPAAPAILGPVVRREVARLNPEMQNPRVDYSVQGEVDRRGRARHDTSHPPQEVLVAAAPGGTIADFGEELSSAGIHLAHLTVLPQALKLLYQEADVLAEPAACYLALPGGPVLAFFHEAQLRLMVEPAFVAADDLALRADSIVEQLDRGNVYLRQNFRGAQLRLLLLADDAAHEDDLIAELGGRLDYPVRKFQRPAGSTGTMLSVGAALGADSGSRPNLSPFVDSPETASAKRTRRIVGLTALSVIALSALWAALSVAGAARARGQVESLNHVAQARIATIEPMRSIAASRQKYAQSVAFLQGQATSRARLQFVLRGIARATPPGMQLLNVEVTRTADVWSANVSGSAFGGSGADILLAIDRFFHGIPRQVATHDVVLAELNDLPPGKFGAGMKFRLTFTTPGTEP